MVGNHCVLPDPGDEIPPSVGVLAIIQQILPNYTGVFMREDAPDVPCERGFFGLVPIMDSARFAHERYADRVFGIPRKRRTVDVSELCFDVKGDDGRRMGDFAEEKVKGT